MSKCKWCSINGHNIMSREYIKFKKIETDTLEIMTSIQTAYGESGWEIYGEVYLGCQGFFTSSLPIKYCPMCGRNLEVENGKA